jgi:hypothetical protein
MSEVAASPAAFQANAERDGNGDPLSARSAGRFLDCRTWVEPASTPTQHLFDACPVRAGFKPCDPDLLSGPSRVEDPKLAVPVAQDARRSQASSAGKFGKGPETTETPQSAAVTGRDRWAGIPLNATPATVVPQQDLAARLDGHTAWLSAQTPSR